MTGEATTDTSGLTLLATVMGARSAATTRRGLVTTVDTTTTRR